MCDPDDDIDEDDYYSKAMKAGYPDKPLNKDSWQLFIMDCNDDPQRLVGYMEANEHIANELERILKTAHDFATLSKELSAFIDDRNEFDYHLSCRWDSEKQIFEGYDPY